MKTTKLFNVYSFFVLGLLIGAFATRFFMGANSGAGTFGTQSYEASLPDQGFIVNTEAFDVSCVSVSCEETCLNMGRSTRECKNACADPVCTGFVDNIKGGHSVAEDEGTDAANNVLSNFGNGGAKRVADDAVRNADQNIKGTGVQASKVGFDYKIENNTYNEACEQYACYEFCISKKGLGGDEFCRENCVSAICENVKSMGILDRFMIQ